MPPLPRRPVRCLLRVVKQTLALLGSFLFLACGDSEGSGGAGGSTGQTTTGQTTTGATMTTSSSSSTGTGGDGGAPPVTALEHLVGRFDESDPAGPTATWSGTSYLTRIDGTDLSIDLEGPAGVFFQVVVDGAPTEVFQTEAGASPYVVASGLPAGTHDVLVYRRVEGFFGAVQFRGFVPGNGTTQVESASPYVHRVEFIGDSITCGYGVEGPNESCNFSGDTESAYETYAAIASRNVGAAAHLVAYSGKGVFQNYGGDPNEPMPVLYERTLTDDSGPTWDFGKFTPEAVVINLGTNDFSAPVAEADFVGAYVDLLGTVRGHYPNAAIFCVTWQHWGAENQGYVLSAIDQFADSNVHSVEFSIDPNDGWGCDYHPSLVTHQKLGQVLTTAFEQTLGW